MRVHIIQPKDSRLLERLQSVHKVLAERVRVRLMRQMERDTPKDSQAHEDEREWKKRGS